MMEESTKTENHGPIFWKMSPDKKYFIMYNLEYKEI